MSVTVDVSEVIAHAASIDVGLAELADGLRGVMETTIAETVAHAKPKFRVDTGASRDSMDGEVTGGGFVVEGEAGPHTSYWPFNEFGTSKMSAAPAVIPSQIEVEPTFYALADALVEGAL